MGDLNEKIQKTIILKIIKRYAVKSVQRSIHLYSYNFVDYRSKINIISRQANKFDIS